MQQLVAVLAFLLLISGATGCGAAPADPARFQQARDALARGDTVTALTVADQISDNRDREMILDDVINRSIRQHDFAIAAALLPRITSPIISRRLRQALADAQSVDAIVHSRLPATGVTPDTSQPNWAYEEYARHATAAGDFALARAAALCIGDTRDREGCFYELGLAMLEVGDETGVEALLPLSVAPEMIGELQGNLTMRREERARAQRVREEQETRRQFMVLLDSGDIERAWATAVAIPDDAVREELQGHLILKVAERGDRERAIALARMMENAPRGGRAGIFSALAAAANENNEWEVATELMAEAVRLSRELTEPVTRAGLTAYIATEYAHYGRPTEARLQLAVAEPLLADIPDTTDFVIGEPRWNILTDIAIAYAWLGEAKRAQHYVAMIPQENARRIAQDFVADILARRQLPP